MPESQGAFGIKRPCSGNRYCNFIGSLVPDRVLFCGGDEQSIVAGCWFESIVHPDEPWRFVCNRCAHRTLACDVRSTTNGRIWLLRCPFDGMPLGRGEATSLIGVGGRRLHRFDELPSSQALLRHIVSTEPEPDSEGTPEFLVSLAIDAFRGGLHELALSLAQEAAVAAPAHRLANIIVARSLQRLGREAEANATLKLIQGGYTPS